MCVFVCELIPLFHSGNSAQPENLFGIVIKYGILGDLFVGLLQDHSNEGAAAVQSASGWEGSESRTDFE